MAMDSGVMDGPIRQDAPWSTRLRAAEASPADLCVLVLQDVLGLDGRARMNTPAKAHGNWAWRYAPDALRPDTAQWLAALAETCDREPVKIDKPPIARKK